MGTTAVNPLLTIVSTVETGAFCEYICCVDNAKKIQKMIKTFFKTSCIYNIFFEKIYYKYNLFSLNLVIINNFFYTDHQVVVCFQPDARSINARPEDGRKYPEGVIARLLKMINQ